MNKIIAPFLTVFIAAVMYSCEKDNTPETCVVINELLAVNSTTCTDQNGEYDDWIELANKCDLELDLSGYCLSDSRSHLGKWRFPRGTLIPAGGYLIVWADNDTLQSGLHANFRLSSEGEKLFFSDPEILIIDRVEYPAQADEIAYARYPDWSGSFVWQAPTFNASNNLKK